MRLTVTWLENDMSNINGSSRNIIYLHNNE